MMKTQVKNILNCCCLCLMAPFAACSWLEEKISPTSEYVFSFFAQLLAGVPGILGVFLRRAYYCMAVEKCSLNVVIGYGSLLVHRKTVIESHVSIGNYAVIGSACIREGCEIGSRVSVTSGKRQHRMGSDGKWTPFVQGQSDQPVIQRDVWIGEGAIVMADVGSGTLIGAGAVVTDTIPAGVIAAGNPARVVREIHKIEV